MTRPVERLMTRTSTTTGVKVVGGLDVSAMGSACAREDWEDARVAILGDVHGNAHVNPQEPHWVQARMEGLGYRLNGTSTAALRRSVRNLAWFLSNVMVFDPLPSAHRRLASPYSPRRRDFCHQNRL